MGQEVDRPTGWRFPARTTIYFLVVATISMGALAFVGLGEIRDINQDNTEIRVDRAARSATALYLAFHDGFEVETNREGSPHTVTINSGSHLIPDPHLDELLDTIAGVNQGAANVFRFNHETNTFDRISTTFRTPEGERVGGTTVEPGLIAEGHPAFETVTKGQPYVGEVPVAGRSRYAYLTPIVESDGRLVGLLAVDVGWVDDLNRINSLAAKRALVSVTVLLTLMAVLGVVVMFLAFRPMHRLIRSVHDLGSEQGPASVRLTSRRDEIGYLAVGLSKVADLQRDLEYRAYNDGLTDIPNRAGFVRELDRRFEDLRAQADPQPAFALLIIDLDGFKEVNDGLGHQAGDELLASLSASLHSDLEPGEFLARLGGDEFALLTAPGHTDSQSATDVADRVTRAISAQHETSAGEMNVTASIGATLVPDQSATPELALNHADLALYSVKATSPGRFQLYQTAFTSPSQRRVHIATELRRALDNGGLRLEYQPLFGADDGVLRGVEALARWTHKTEGPIPPMEFVPVAESTGLIHDLGFCVLELACDQISAWSKEGLQPPVVSINVSPIQLRHPDFVSVLEDCLRRHRIPHNSVCLELTENARMAHEDGRHIDLLNQLVALGVTLSIDDFGTGYSSLSYLHNLPVHEVKIDRMFIAGATHDARQAKLYTGVVTLAASLGLDVVTEGIETSEELGLAVTSGSGLLQGFYLGRPVAPDAVAACFGMPAPNWLAEYAKQRP